MKYRVFFSLLLSSTTLFLCQCSNPKPKETSQVDEAAMDSAINRVQAEDEGIPRIDKRCFESETAMNRQPGSAELTFMIVGKNASGKFNILPVKGDSMIGMFSGTITSSVIKGRYTYKGGNQMNSAQVAIALQDGAATVYLAESSKNGKLSEENLSDLKPFKSLTEVDCQ